MYEFINWLRALAAIVITNAHYEDIYPLKIFANGGLLGDAIFFAVSGFCLANIKHSFVKWYLKRIVRIYVPLWLITAVYCLLNWYQVNGLTSIISLFIYPTYYHFIRSIIVLYIPYYFLMANLKHLDNKMKNCIIVIFAGVLAIQLLVYILAFDKSYYHIDSVYEKMIWFFYFENMIIGAYFRKNEKNENNNRAWLGLVFLLISLVLYFISKIIFSKYPNYSALQIVNQYILLIVVFNIFWVMKNSEDKLVSADARLQKCISVLASMTLEIYLVQYALIERLNICVFPYNFFIVTLGIIIAAMLLKQLSDAIKSTVAGYIAGI